MTLSTDPHASEEVIQAGQPLGERQAVVILVHGRNASPQNILELAGPLAHPAVTWLAPAAANSTWYPFSFLADRARNEPFLSSALRRLDTLVARGRRRRRSAERIVLLGFSQGACLASEFVATRPARYGGLVAFSGGLIGPPGTRWDTAGSLDGTPAFFGCSDVDAHVPRDRVEESAGC